ncbi:hypothetical protein GN244_ATG02198 [Phytophthora infestans]|uniref:Uncharacterized protein n=1 Tax=Phytophthora infestans TaxID=4787 RepID=A0A833W7E4_PHYIN|nr:hypothetical protein GN244_ATG02198 [Phytophthora infestans]KAF4139321.1 hypothetical protein GN958_ATG11537 [Phytophthora infestans]
MERLHSTESLFSLNGLCSPDDTVQVHAVAPRSLFALQSGRWVAREVVVHAHLGLSPGSLGCLLYDENGSLESLD